jgi:hypothetical protein
MSRWWTISSSSTKWDAWTSGIPDGAQMPEPPQNAAPVISCRPTALHAMVHEVAAQRRFDDGCVRRAFCRRTALHLGVQIVVDRRCRHVCKDTETRLVTGD